MADLEQVIEDAVNDSQFGTETPEVTPEPVESTPVETAPDTTEPVASDTPTEDVESLQVKTPAAPEEQEPLKDEFEKQIGIPQMGVTGRENRIPYSRVKKITEKAGYDGETRIAEAVLGRKLAQGEKALDVVKAHVAQIPTLQSQVTDYETRLNTVGEFENVMANEPERFLEMLSRVPAYSEFFAFVQQAYQNAQNPAAESTPAESETPAPSNMPEPDETLADGSKVYSLEGLKSLLAWNSNQVEGRVTKQLTKNWEDKYNALETRFKPFESKMQERARIDATLPLIRAQIAEARTWHAFTENEAEIVKKLESNPKISLREAYQEVIIPKLIDKVNNQRQTVLQEIKTAPTSTSVPTRAATKPTAPASTGPRTTEDIILESLKAAGLK